MRVDNFQLIGDFLFGKQNRPLNKDEFYFIQIVKRHKDGNKIDTWNKHYMIKFYAIVSLQQFIELKPEIMSICKATNARAYAYLCRINKDNVENYIRKNVERALNGHEHGMLINMYNYACMCGRTTNDMRRIDIDNATMEDTREVSECVQELGGKVLLTVPTKSGYHLITNDFNTTEFFKKYPKYNASMNPCTLLYYEN